MWRTGRMEDFGIWKLTIVADPSYYISIPLEEGEIFLKCLLLPRGNSTTGLCYGFPTRRRGSSLYPPRRPSLSWSHRLLTVQLTRWDMQTKQESARLKVKQADRLRDTMLPLFVYEKWKKEIYLDWWIVSNAGASKGKYLSISLKVRTCGRASSPASVKLAPDWRKADC